MSSKHTPGPWFIAANRNPKATHPSAPEFVSNTHRYVATLPAIEDEFGEPCAEIVAQTFDGPNQAGNATLIAASPELLAALELITTEIQERTYVDGNMLSAAYARGDVCSVATMDIARAAIAKAKGEA